MTDLEIIKMAMERCRIQLVEENTNPSTLTKYLHFSLCLPYDDVNLNFLFNKDGNYMGFFCEKDMSEAEILKYFDGLDRHEQLLFLQKMLDYTL
jgi:hypothetical protein